MGCFFFSDGGEVLQSSFVIILWGLLKSLDVLLLAGEEKNRFGLWWRECGIDGFDLSNCV